MSGRRLPSGPVSRRGRAVLRAALGLAVEEDRRLRLAISCSATTPHSLAGVAESKPRPRGPAVAKSLRICKPIAQVVSQTNGLTDLIVARREYIFIDEALLRERAVERELLPVHICAITTQIRASKLAAASTNAPVPDHGPKPTSTNRPGTPARLCPRRPRAEQFGRRQRPWPRRRNPMQAPGDDRRLQYGLQR